MKIGGIIRGWYKKNKRDLPWRLTGDPYHIWISEIILQQTRINQGIDYYISFLEAFPDVQSLARAGEDDVLNLWQGLGYYSRARNLHQAAKAVVQHQDGVIPQSYDELLRLKGVGTYTAAAIASICFGEPRAVVDGNVARVISRLFGVEEAVNSSAGKEIINSHANELMDPGQPGLHNQAMMEFGALQCVPRSPHCEKCPLQNNCYATKTGMVDQLPVKIPKRKPVERWFYFYLLLCKGEMVISRRSGNDIWKSLYQFPMFEWDKPLEDPQLADPRIADPRLVKKGMAETGWVDRQLADPRMADPRMADPRLVKKGMAETGWVDRQLADPRAVDSSRTAEPSIQYGDITIEKISEPVKHQLSHQTIMARFIHARLDAWPEPLPPGWIRISSDRLDDYPVPRLINRYMEVVKI